MNNMFLGTINQIISIVLILIILVGIFYLHKNVLGIKNELNRQKLELDAYKQTLDRIISYYQSNSSIQNNVIDVDDSNINPNVMQNSFENEYLENNTSTFIQPNNYLDESEESDEDDESNEDETSQDVLMNYSNYVVDSNKDNIANILSNDNSESEDSESEDSESDDTMEEVVTENNPSNNDNEENIEEVVEEEVDEDEEVVAQEEEEEVVAQEEEEEVVVQEEEEEVVAQEEEEEVVAQEEVVIEEDDEEVTQEDEKIIQQELMEEQSTKKAGKRRNKKIPDEDPKEYEEGDKIISGNDNCEYVLVRNKNRNKRWKKAN